MTPEEIAQLQRARLHVNVAATAAETAMREADKAATIIEALVAGGEVPPVEPVLSVVSIADAETVEVGEVVRFEVSLNKPAAVAVTVQSTVSLAGSAVGSLTIPVGGTRSFIEVADAPVGTFTVRIHSAEGATLGDDTATGTVLGEEPPPGEPTLLLHLENVTKPVTYPAGSLAKVRQACMGVMLKPNGKHQKLLGCASSDPGPGGMCIGVNPKAGLDVWHAGGGKQNAIAKPPVVAWERGPQMLFWSVDTDTHGIELDLATGAAASIAAPPAKLDGICAVGQGFWSGELVDPIAAGTEILVLDLYDRPLTDVEIAAWQAKYAGLLDPGGGNGGGGEPPADPPVDPPVEPPPGSGILEPVDTSAHQVAISVGTSPRQTIIGLGWGANSALSGAAQAMFVPVKQHIAKLSTGLNAKVLRIFTPEAPQKWLQFYKPYWDLVMQHGFTDIFASCYVHASNPDTGMATVAAGIKTYHDNGVPIGYFSLQNEPDGGTDQSVPGDAAAIRARYIELRAELDKRGLQAVKILSYEWRHPTTHGPGEYDKIADLVPAVVHGSCYHIYDKGPNKALYDDRYLTKGAHGYSTETGNMGAPNAGARGVSGVNNGSRMEIIHYAVVVSAGNEPSQQGLIMADGSPRPWYGQIQAIWTNLQQGSTVFLCESGDRPGMPEQQARRMETLAPRMPRACVAAARRPDGRWQLVAVSTAYGSDSPSIHAGGHYPALKQQLTVTIPQLAGKSGIFTTRRAALSSGSMSGPSTVQMVGGRVRFTLAPGETVGMTEGAA